jgi:hypothetical protein
MMLKLTPVDVEVRPKVVKVVEDRKRFSSVPIVRGWERKGFDQPWTA